MDLTLVRRLVRRFSYPGIHIPANPRNEVLTPDPHSAPRSNKSCSESEQAWNQIQNGKALHKAIAIINGCSWVKAFLEHWKPSASQKRNKRTKQNYTKE